jgi:hypothetical protein
MPAKLPNPRVGLNDHALLLGSTAPCAAPELVELNVEELEFPSAGVAVTLDRAKAAQEGRSRRIGTRTAPATSVARSIAAGTGGYRGVDAVSASATSYVRCDRAHSPPLTV